LADISKAVHQRSRSERDAAVSVDVVSDGTQWQASGTDAAGVASQAASTVRSAPATPGPLELGEFVRGLAHDLANPLNALAMNAELTKVLLDRGDSAAAREVLQRLLADCARCGRLVQSFQRFGAALQASPRERVAVGTLLQTSIQHMHCEPGSSAVEIHFHGATDALVEVDNPAFERAFAGVLCNASEAGATTIDVRIATDEEWARIDIIDNGSGIEARWHERVMEPFFSTRRSKGASGLGLTLMRELLRRHAGGLHIESAPGRGTTVTIELPRAV
jgi:signal transduction histidine kinase